MISRSAIHHLQNHGIHRLPHSQAKGADVISSNSSIFYSYRTIKGTVIRIGASNSSIESVAPRRRIGSDLCRGIATKDSTCVRHIIHCQAAKRQGYLVGKWINSGRVRDNRRALAGGGHISNIQNNRSSVNGNSASDMSAGSAGSPGGGINADSIEIIFEQSDLRTHAGRQSSGSQKGEGSRG